MPAQSTYPSDLLEFPFPDYDVGSEPIDAGSPSICDACPGCLEYCRYEPLPNEEGFYRLIDAMVTEIDLLEAEVVRTRQVLAGYLPERWADGLRQDIFSGLSRCFSGDFEEYDSYVSLCCGGIDPLQSPGHTARMLRLRDGTDETTNYPLRKKQPQKLS